MSEEQTRVSLPVSGMTCAACARRVEKALSGTAGVGAANVNLATEKATVEYDAAYVGLPQLVEAVEDIQAGECEGLRGRLVVAAVLTALILVGSLPHMFGFKLPISTGWLNVGMLLLATPVQFWAGWCFYRGPGAL